MSEPDFPYNKRPRPEEKPATIPPPPDYPPSPPSPPPIDTQSVSKFSCQIVVKRLTQKEELNYKLKLNIRAQKRKYKKARGRAVYSMFPLSICTSATWPVSA
jgi:hypothetical protein